MSLPTMLVLTCTGLLMIGGASTTYIGYFLAFTSVAWGIVGTLNDIARSKKQ